MVWGVYTGNLVTDRQTDGQTDLVSPTPPHWSSKAFKKHFSEIEEMSSSVWDLYSNSKTKKDEICIGLDFGTSMSSCSIWNRTKKRAKVIKNSLGKKLTPSIVRFNDNFELIMNDSTEHDITLFSVYNVKSHLLEYPNDDFITITNTNGIKHDISIIHTISFIIKHLINHAQVYITSKRLKLGYKEKNDLITSIVIGIPVSYTSSQILKLEQAINLAGINNIYFMSESTAAAMSYGLLVAGTKTVAIFDIGKCTRVLVYSCI